MKKVNISQTFRLNDSKTFDILIDIILYIIVTGKLYNKCLLHNNLSSSLNSYKEYVESSYLAV